ncbi:CRISPR-associated protein Cas4 [Micromonospora sp. WMMD882]|uniref:CRISPR-associated protein Cas4 n=1 Tax=Micromonospora sp. WMMD882 TaxID=3015151 RepID=UPI00248BB633|nr:CRISPR-associated protein Cas4 [Micromonospora sp. WMMD882]WBB78154.1 CRISPR-associated protein Cas4 [Micromonospora sp. WMMD882]
MTDPADGDPPLVEVPLSALEHYAYCHRQTALIHVEGVWSESADTVRGDLSHRVVDLPGVTKRAGVKVVRSLPVASRAHGLRGVCDVVEFDGRVAVPVEYKVGRYQPGGPAELQLAGQALCLIEAGFDVPTGHIYSVAERRRHPVTIDAAILTRVTEAADAIRRLLASVRLPVARNDTRCRRCSLREDCLPDITDGRTKAAPVDLFTPRPLGPWRD